MRKNGEERALVMGGEEREGRGNSGDDNYALSTPFRPVLQFISVLKCPFLYMGVDGVPCVLGGQGGE